MTLNPWSVLVIFLLAPVGTATLVTLLVLALTKPGSGRDEAEAGPHPVRDDATDPEQTEGR